MSQVDLTSAILCWRTLHVCWGMLAGIFSCSGVYQIVGGKKNTVILNLNSFPLSGWIMLCNFTMYSVCSHNISDTTVLVLSPAVVIVEQVVSSKHFLSFE